MRTWERSSWTRVGVGVLLVGVLGVCGASAAAQRSIRVPCKEVIRGQPRVCIDFPREGVTVSGSAVRVALKSAGIDIAAVSDGKAGAAHYHLFLDVAPPAEGEAIPQGPGITHMGDGQKEFLLSNLTPGLHRLIVTLGDNAHVSIGRQQSDTTYFSVAAP